MYRRGSEAEAGELPGGPVTFANALISSLDIAAHAMVLRSNACESPIEVILGAYLAAEFAKISPERWVLVPQYWIERFRFDFAVVSSPTVANPMLLIECDGREFHSSPRQIRRDGLKNEKCLKLGIPLLRFTGKEIHRDPRFCVEQCMACLGGVYG